MVDKKNNNTTVAPKAHPNFVVSGVPTWACQLYELACRILNKEKVKTKKQLTSFLGYLNSFVRLALIL